ncbi:DNA-binding protein [Actinoplanes sp. SE50]|uniref:helix-turn-helix domain-containing protein n=1 Tax=unclassified Actinoplanes TaxID=2626549 RepID=UPI00023EC7EC|nr:MULTISPECIES: helix-turn-helix transcriptional regulator [unclassified Actinoplanes]AEV85328.1 XRE family transcriptional regulator [Actinoplanes sp. SE50/110]ATO83723.1 DNA-binding protein [Actinoplanes sp. SE50]SLM01131.1 transcriptional regulator [Actinoplanes sp. SE50/110]
MTPRPSADPAIGDRIRDRRLRRGWSIRFAASRAGVSHATWSRIERGRQAADNRFMLADLAAALDCSPAELAGTAVPAGDREAVAAHAAVHAVRQALVDLDLTATPASLPALPSLPELTRTAALLDTLRQACDYAGAGRLLPGLLRGLHAATGSEQRPAALRLLCEVTFIASSVLRNLGHPAEAWLGAERCRDAAEAARDPILRGYAGYSRAAAAGACGSYDRAYTLAAQAVDELRPHAARAGWPEMTGSLQLICADSSRGRKRSDDSRAWLTEAAALAARTGETTTLGLYFGPTNVNVWRVGIESDGDEPGRAVAIARETDPAVLPVGFRQVFFYADTARALTRLRHRDREAIRFLLTAERVAPQHVHTSSLVQETARALLDRSRRAAGGTELRALCERLRIG